MKFNEIKKIHYNKDNDQIYIIFNDHIQNKIVQNGCILEVRDNEDNIIGLIIENAKRKFSNLSNMCLIKLHDYINSDSIKYILEFVRLNKHYLS